MTTHAKLVDDEMPSLERRLLVIALATSLVAISKPGLCANFVRDERINKLREIENNARGRLGVYILDTETQIGFGWRENERFAHCSSFKLSLAAMALSMADHGKLDLAEKLSWSASEILPVSPVTKEKTRQGLSIEELAHATLVTSDNTAANVLIKRFGGPNKLTNFWRSLGDRTSRLDRYEPDLNVTPLGSTLDTTSPKAMAETTATLINGNFLSATSKAKLKAWMVEVRTGSQRLRAGFPADWISGDKTGTGIGKTKHTYVDIAYGGPINRSPLVITAYFEPDNLVEPMDPHSTKVLADVGRVASAIISNERT